MKITNEQFSPTLITDPSLDRSIPKLNRINAIGSRRRLIHNHPSGDPTPSQADVHMTKAIIDIATPLGIAVHDHIIVGRGGHASLKGMKLI